MSYCTLAPGGRLEHKVHSLSLCPVRPLPFPLPFPAPIIVPERGGLIPALYRCYN